MVDIAVATDTSAGIREIVKQKATAVCRPGLITMSV